MKWQAPKASVLILTMLAACVQTPELVTADYVEVVVDDAADEALRRGRAGQLDAFSIGVASDGNSGREGRTLALRFQWDPKLLEDVDWARIGQHELLELASVAIEGPAGADALDDWCEPHGKAETPRFCAGAAASALARYGAR